ncbi:MAG: iron-containing alcohol dehydrogenase, partial [Actinomycetes bacterium]
MENVEAFNNHLPVKVRFGEGKALTLPDVLLEAGASKVFLMVDEGIEKFNPAAKACIDKLLTHSEFSVTTFEKPGGEPTIDMVDDATKALVASGAQAIIALGGGSIIDTAKAARLCAQLGVTFREFQSRKAEYPVPTVALIAMPTSAGTGSEVSG